MDWIVEAYGRYVPIEVKWTENPHTGDAKHLSTFLAEYPNAPMGFVVCRCRERQMLAENITALPWSELGEILKVAQAVG